MRINRRELVVGAAMARAAFGAKGSYKPKARTGPSMDDLARVGARPVLRSEGIKEPVVIHSLELLKAHGDYFVRVRSTGGAEGISVCNPPRADYLDRILKELVFPAFLKKDARDLENLLWETYR